MNAVTGDVIYEKAADEKLPMASTTKIMTLITALNNSSGDEIVTVSKNAAYQEGSSAYLKPDAKITMRDLCYGLMLNSGNDAAVAIAEHISGNAEEFSKLMNETAKEIGARDTHFMNPNGLHNDEHYTTARDLAKLTRYALGNESFCEIVSTRMYTSKMTMPDGEMRETEYINHNRLLGELDGCIGVKTGFTKDAGRCLVSAVDKDGAKYITVTLNDSDDWQTHKDLYKDAMASGYLRTVVRTGDCMEHVVSGREECKLIAKTDFSVFLNSERDNGFEIIKHIPDTVDFSLNAGEKVGYAEILSDGEVIGAVDVVAERDFAPKGTARVHNCFMFTLLNILRSIV